MRRNKERQINKKKKRQVYQEREGGALTKKDKEKTNITRGKIQRKTDQEQRTIKIKNTEVKRNIDTSRQRNRERLRERDKET